MRHLFTFLAALASVLLNAQGFNQEMDISRSDLETNSYSRDSSAVALVLYDHGNAFVNEDTFRLNVEIQQKVKILKPEGLERGEITLRAYKNKSSKEKIKKIIGFTYRLENEKIIKEKLQPSAIFTVEEENYDKITFVLPKLQVGSVFTVSYMLDSPFFNKFQPWYFQGADPVLYSEFNTSIPGNFKYNTKLVGDLKLKDRSHSIKKYCLKVGNGGSADCSESKFVMTNIPAYYEEDFTTTPDNYISRIEYELVSIQQFDGSIKNYTRSWKDVDGELEYDNDFGRQIKKKSLVKKVLPEDIKSQENSIEKAQKIYQFVLDKYKWNGKSGRFDVSVKRLLKESVGSTFELNLLLLNLLHSEGFEAYPVLGSTRANGFVTKLYPVLSDYNYLFIKLIQDDKSHYLDATSIYRPFGELPYKALNGDARVIDFDNESYWERVTEKEFILDSYRVSTSISVDNIVSGSVEHMLTGYFSFNKRKDFFDNPNSYIESLTNNYEDYNIENHKVVQTLKNDEGFNESYDISIELESQADRIYFNPFIYKFFSENPFKHERRTYPIDFGYKSIFTYAFELDLNGLYNVVEIPEDQTYALPGNAGTLLTTVKEDNGKVVVFMKMKLDEAIYKPGFYFSLQKLFGQMIDVQKNTLVVLERIL